MVQKINIMLKAMVGTNELVEQWWKSPNKSFNGLTPEEVPILEVYQYVAGHFSR